MLPWYYSKQNKVFLCLTDTSLCIYICVKHFGMADIKEILFLIFKNITLDFFEIHSDSLLVVILLREFAQNCPEGLPVYHTAK